MLGVLIELMFWRGPLGVITRSIKKDGGRSGLFLAISVRILILRWSIALWQGLILGCWMQSLHETVTSVCFADHITVSSPGGARLAAFSAKPNATSVMETE